MYLVKVNLNFLQKNSLLLISGSITEHGHQKKKYDFYDLKGDLEFVFPKYKFEYRKNDKFNFIIKTFLL